MSSHHFLLLLFLLHVAAASHRALDWRDCTTQACYVFDACTSGDNSGRKLVEAKSARDVKNQRDCEFVMFLRPMAAQWVVQLRLKLAPKLRDKRIGVTRGDEQLFECLAKADGSMHVVKLHETLQDDVLPHADSYHTRTQMYCLFTVETKRGEPVSPGPLTISYKDGRGAEKKLNIDNMGDIGQYMSCDGRLVMLSNHNPAATVAKAPVDITRERLACPRGQAWKMMIDIDGQLQEARGGRCAKWQDQSAFDFDMQNGNLWQMQRRFHAVCLAEVGCSTCSAPLHLHCPHCAPVRLAPGNGTNCARLRCPDPGYPDKFAIGGKTYVGKPVCGMMKKMKRQGEQGRPFGWSIKDVDGKKIEFDAAACVKKVSCHHTSPLRLFCADPTQCVQPFAVDFVEAGATIEGVVCPADLFMRFRANESDEWTDAADMECDPRTGRWNALNGPNTTLLAPHTTVECIARPDLFLRYATIVVAISFVLLYGIAYFIYFWTRKADAEFDARQRSLSKEFHKIKEYPRSPEKSERSARSKREKKEEKEEKKDPVPIVDLRIYPDELTLRRMRKKDKKKKKEEKKPAIGFPRPRESDDPADFFCKSEKEAGKEGWEKWIAKTGGFVQGKKPREEVLRLRAEKRAAKAKRLEDEKNAKEMEEKEGKEQKERNKDAPAPASAISRPVPSKSIQLATDEFLSKAKKAKEIEDRFITIGPTPPTSPGPVVEKRQPPREYKRKSAPAVRDDEIKFEPPTESKDASVLKGLATERKDKEDEEKLMTATSYDLNSTDARDKSPTGDDDRAIETKESKKQSVLQQSPKDKEADAAIESTEEERRKRKKKSDKNKKKKERKSGSPGGESNLPKTMTAVGDDEQRSRGEDKAAKSTPAMKTPSRVTPTGSANSTATGETKRRRRQLRCVESKGLTKGLDKRIGDRKRSGAATLSRTKDGVDKKKE